MTRPGSAVVVLDFGGQYTQLIARRVRDARVFSVVLPPGAPLEEIRGWNPVGVILSGGPESVYEEGAPVPAPGLLDLEVPILGLCYGMQWMAHVEGGQVLASQGREYGRATARVTTDSPLFHGLEERQTVWMSHGDSVTRPPSGSRVIARTDDTPIAGFEDAGRRHYGVQFHPEVRHTAPPSCRTSSSASAGRAPTGAWRRSGTRRWRRSAGRRPTEP